MSLDQEEFYKLAQKPEFGETMAFQVQRNKIDGKTFSAEAVEDLARRIAMFMAARTLARWEETGEVPRFVSAEVTLDWDAKPTDQPDPPWYRGQEGEPPDGVNRLDGERK